MPITSVGRGAGQFTRYLHRRGMLRPSGRHNYIRITYPLVIKGYAHKLAQSGEGHRSYVITMPKLNISGYENLTETIRLIL